jgi:hypothetical protein
VAEHVLAARWGIVDKPGLLELDPLLRAEIVQPVLECALLSRHLRLFVSGEHTGSAASPRIDCQGEPAVGLGAIVGAISRTSKSSKAMVT